MRKSLASLLLLACSTQALANLPYFPLTFPRDEGAHYKNIPYAIKNLNEWWYFNGILKTDDGHSFGYDVAIFNPAFDISGINTKPFLHIQLADLDNKKSYGFSGDYPINAGEFSTAGISMKLKDAFLVNKKLIQGEDVYTLKAKGTDGETELAVDLKLTPTSPIFLINEKGLMSMMNDTNSYYYSIPHFKTTGSITLNQTKYKINTTPGDSWMDHQWGDFTVEKNGWEWFSIRLENGFIANVFMIIEFKTKQVIGGVANIILPSGEKRVIPYDKFTIARSDYWLDTKLGIEYPMTFDINFPTLGLSLKNSAAFPEQELNGYWEGYSNVTANYQHKNVSGYSYTEIVYERPNVKNVR